MNYVGIDNSDGTCAIGIFNEKRKEFTHSSHLPIDRTLGFLYYHLYKRQKSTFLYALIKAYSLYCLKKATSRLSIEKNDTLIVAGYFSPKVFLDATYALVKDWNFPKGQMIVSDHLWGYINSVKLHPQFSYPALVASSSTKHSILAYLPNKQSIHIIKDAVPTIAQNYDGLGILTIDIWVYELGEKVHWPGQKVIGTKNVYELYKERGLRGKAVVDMRKEIRKSKEPFAEDVFRELFSEKMRTLKLGYASLEQYKDDWVASQQQLLRDLFTHIRAKESKKRKIKTFIITGGISKNSALSTIKGWHIAPDSLSGSYAGGKSMAFLGYCVEHEGLRIRHNRWKDSTWD